MTKIIVVGGGNAGLCAAIAARDAGADVCLLERGPRHLRGGNSAFTAGLMRTVYDEPADLLELIDGLTASEIADTEFGRYTQRDFLDTMGRITEYRCDPDLASVLTAHSHPTLVWMRHHGVRFAPSYGRQAFRHHGKFRFWGGAVLEVVGGGPGLVDSLYAEAEQLGVSICYESRATDLLMSGGAVSGVRSSTRGTISDLAADAVVLACGGFESDVEWRTRYLGPGWDLAKVRGTRFNTGDGIRMALAAGASPAGNWSGCHAVAWDQNAPEFGDPAVGDGFQKHSYPFGIVVNVRGRRFLDEGADFRNYTYAKYGREILAQPGQVAWQIFDAQANDLLRDEYRIRQVTRITADTLEELAAKIDGLDGDAFLDTVKRFNQAVRRDVTFNPTVLDGRSTVGLDPPKSNWANPIETPPFQAYGVTCGITFTFGGVRVDDTAQVITGEGGPLPNLYACGEMVGGLFYFNYPGGTGLTSGAVFGKLAGTNAATRPPHGGRPR